MGASVGDDVGELVVGLEVGDDVGELVVGLEVGDDVGELVVGLEVGDDVGEVVGASEIWLQNQVHNLLFRHLRLVHFVLDNSSQIAFVKRLWPNRSSPFAKRFLFR